MRNYQPGYYEHWEDAYTAELHPTFQALQALADEYWLNQLGPLNLPVWVEFDAENEQEYDCGPTVSVGVFLPRHGYAAVHLAPATPEQYQAVIQTLFRVWSPCGPIWASPATAASGAWSGLRRNRKPIQHAL